MTTQPTTIALPKATAENTIIIERIFDAPPALVWQAWTDPQHQMRWWGPENFTAPSCEIDLRVGGKYLFCMQSPEGQNYYTTGVYQEIVPQKRLVFTESFADEQGSVVSGAEYGMGDDMPLAMLATLVFEEVGGKTKMTLTYVGMPAGENSDMAALGWNQSFDKLAGTLR
jgi:uncharacterized protein YndB with AHSA1/START domain